MVCNSSVAILLATYNGEKFIDEQLESLERQTYSDFTIFVRDDGSTDRTLDIVKERAKKSPDKYQIMEATPLHDPKKCFMWMLKNVEAKYYMFCDQDDVWMIEKTKILMEVINNLQLSAMPDGVTSKKVAEAAFEPDPICVFSDMYVVDENRGAIASSFIEYIGRDINLTDFSQVIIDNPASGNAMLFNKALRDIAISISDEDLARVEMHDAWVAAIASCFGGLVGVDEPLVYYRQTGQNTLGAITESKIQKVVRNLKEVKDGTLVNDKKQFLARSKKLARILISTDDIPTGVKDVLAGYLQMHTWNKAKRLAFCQKYGFKRANGDAWMKLFI